MDPDLLFDPVHRADQPLVRLVNVLVAGLALLVLSPLILLIAIAIRLDSPGPAFYRQLRVGLDRRWRAGIGRPPGRAIGRPPDGAGGPESASRRGADLGGRPFLMYKFRTMRVDAERETGPVWADLADGRTTRLGRFLRRYRLDEIPQFWNVLKGDMSVVGPRPERPNFVHQLREELEQYPLRQRVPPGITGWAQVNRRADRSVDDVKVKLTYDLEYLRSRSVTFDLRIMARTLPVMLIGRTWSDQAERKG